jgi:chemotaxis protein CheD
MSHRHHLNRNATVPKPNAVRGHENIQRTWDPQIQKWCAKILPGEYYVTTGDEGITTVLGSCISACIRDPALRLGGMNHFMLPEDTSNGKSSWLDEQAGLSTRYGSFAMESLINDLMKLGAKRERMEVKLFGGGKILSSMTDVGARNISFAHSWLKTEHLQVVGEDVGDTMPRRVIYLPSTGKVLVKHLRTLESRAIATREQQYLTSFKQKPVENDVELF